MATKKHRKMIGDSRVFTLLLRILLALFMALLLVTVIKTCSDCRRKAIIDQTGYLPDDENWDSIPDITPPYNPEDLDSLPQSVLIESLFPPIGNQGSRGTCVAWAVGYNMKTALNARQNHWTESDLRNPENQTSPKDLWLGIPPNQKGAYCEGTTFHPTFSVLANQGAADMKRVPYHNLGNCGGIATGNPDNRIKGFGCLTTKPDPTNLRILKAYIRDSIPLVISARLGDSFMKWNDDTPIKTDTYRYNGRHAYHAMVLSGYDDARNSFRVRNSWGPEWGDKGSIWVDYDFFCNSFCEEVFVAEN